MKEFKVTATAAHDLLRKAVELKGKDYIYPTYPYSSLGCYYAKEGKPDCIVGHVLFDLGVPIADMSWDEEGLERGSMASGNIDIHRLYLQRAHGLTFEDAAWEMLCSAQTVQDDRETWGVALRSAEAIVTYLKKYESE